MKNRLILTIVFACCILTAYTQQTFTLEESIAYAIDNHPTVKQTGIAVEQSNVRYQQARNQLLPNLNAGINHNYSLGSTINPSTNSRAPLNIQNDQFSIGTNVDLFDWSNYVTISLRESEQQGAQKQQEVIKQSIALNVVRDFYQYQYDKAWQEVLQSQLKGIEEQIDRTVKEVEIGTRPKSDIYDIKANLGNIRQAWVIARNQAELSKNNLLITMNMPGEEAEFLLEEELAVESISPEQINEFIAKQPVMQSYQLQLNQEDEKIRLAKSAALPKLFGNYQWSTFYSKELKGENNIDFGSQLDQNKNQFIGFGLNIPIFNRQNIKTETQLAQLAKKDILAEKEKTELELLQTLNNIYTNYNYAVEKYQLLTENFENQRLSYLRSEEKYKEGLIDSYTFFVVRNNWLDANFNLIKSKYEVMLQQDLLQVFGE